MTYFFYGMRLRGLSLGCQPMNGLVDRITSAVSKPHRYYYDILVYNRELTEKELKEYELDFIGTWHFEFGKQF